MPSSHIVVSGTGRAGTTFLMQMFTYLGLDTGFKHYKETVSSRSHAGMERPEGESLPHIIKGPSFCHKLREFVVSGHSVEHLIIPMRDLYAAAESRRSIHRERGPWVAGSLFGTINPKEQEVALAMGLYELFLAAAEFDIPVTILSFPRLATEPAYLYGKLSWMMPVVTWRTFRRAFKRVSRPHLIHNFAASPVELRSDEASSL